MVGVDYYFRLAVSVTGTEFNLMAMPGRHKAVICVNQGLIFPLKIAHWAWAEKENTGQIL
jgi:hypothetical protein